MASILLVEDDLGIRQVLGEILRGANYDVSKVVDFGNFEGILANIRELHPDLILLDLNLVGLSGLELLRLLRTKQNTPVIILTGDDAESSELLAMGYGADDFVLKPYKSELLLLRIRAVLRRTMEGGRGDSYRLGAVEIDLARGVMVHGGRRVHLTKNEMIILRQLLDEQGKIVSRETLMTELWNNQEYINDNALTVNVSRLRAKLEKISGTKAIETHKGLGYSLSEVA